MQQMSRREARSELWQMSWRWLSQGSSIEVMEYRCHGGCYIEALVSIPTDSDTCHSDIAKSCHMGYDGDICNVL